MMGVMLVIRRRQEDQSRVITVEAETGVMSFEDREGTISQEIQAGSKNWKTQGNEFFPRASRRKCSPADAF